jgi:cytosine/adenosine deaminase-related metal-dependent hydrolase
MRFLSPDFLFTLAPQSLSEENLSENQGQNKSGLALSGTIKVQNPIHHGTLVLEEDGRIIEVLRERPDREDLELVEGGICPGFINSHVHLELSHLLGKIEEGTGLVSFIQSIQKLRASEPEIVQEKILQAYGSMKKEGIMGFGDISNSKDSFPIKSSGDLLTHSFLECFGFIPSRANEVFDRTLELQKEAIQWGLRSSITPHAPYSVSTELFEKIRNQKEEITSIHNQESDQENRFYKEGEGDFTRLYQSFGMDIGFFRPYGKNSLPVYHEWLGDGKKIFVHNTYTTIEDLEIADSEKVYWCFCPGANQFIEGRIPDLEMFQKQFGRVLVGTDSLASNHQLSVLEELKCIQKGFPKISLNQLLVWACRNGSDFFGWDSLGSLEKGKKPGIIHIQNLRSDFTLDLDTRIQRIL